MKDVRPFFVPSAGAIRALRWDLLIDGESEPLGDHIEDWDQRTWINIVSTIIPDCRTIRSDVFLDDSVALVWAIGWRSTDTSLVGGPVLIPFGDDVVDCKLSIPPDRVGAGIVVTRRLLLSDDRVAAPGEARHAGSVLWSDEHSVRLSGDGAAFPTEIIDFASLNRDRLASWYLELPDSVQAPVMGSMLLVINAADTDLVAAVTRTRRRTDAQNVLVQEMESGVVEELVRWAVSHWAEASDADDDTVGAAARTLASRVLPDPRAWVGSDDSMALRAAIISGSRALGYGRLMHD